MTTREKLPLIVGGVVGVVALICITVIMAMDKDPTPLVLFCAALGLGGLFGAQQGIKTLVNGNIERMIELLRTQGDHLARSTPPEVLEKVDSTLFP